MLESALALLGAMSAILLVWTLLSVWLTGIGLCAVRVALGARPSVPPFLAAPWLGLAVLIEFLQLWHLLLPVNGVAFSVLAICGSAAAGFNAKWVVQWLYRNRATWGASALPFALACVWLANRAIGPCFHYDSAFYHLAGVRWANEFAVERGLGNLFAPFALNNSNLLLNAMMEFGPLEGRSAHVFNGFFAALMIPVIINGWRSLSIHNGRRAGAGLFAVLTSVLVVKYAVTSDLASPSTDMPAALFGLFGAWRLFRMLLGIPRSSPEWDVELVLTTAVLSASVTLKLSSIFFAAVAWLLAVGAWMRSRHRREHQIGSSSFSKLRQRPFAASVILSVALIGTWMFRGYLLSGFPMFPSAICGMQVDWRVSEPTRLHAIAALEMINKTTYLNRGADITGLRWAPAWFRDTFLVRSGVEGVAPAALAISAVLAAVWPARRPGAAKAARSSVRRFQSATNAGWILIAPATLALVVWFVNVPAPRLGAMAWWIVAATATSMALLRQPTRWLQRYRKCILYACGVMTVVPVLHIAALIQFRYRHDPNMAYYGIPAWRVVPFYGPGPDHGFYPLHHAELVVTQSESGLQLYTPKPPGQDLWYGPLPGTPDMNPKLRLRKLGDLGKGFTVQPSSIRSP